MLLTTIEKVRLRPKIAEAKLNREKFIADVKAYADTLGVETVRHVLCMKLRDFNAFHTRGSALDILAICVPYPKRELILALLKDYQANPIDLFETEDDSHANT